MDSSMDTLEHVIDGFVAERDGRTSIRYVLKGVCVHDLRNGSFPVGYVDGDELYMMRDGRLRFVGTMEPVTPFDDDAYS